MAFLLKIKGLYSTDNVRRYEMAGQCQFNGQMSFCFSRFRSYREVTLIHTNSMGRIFMHVLIYSTLFCLIYADTLKWHLWLSCLLYSHPSTEAVSDETSANSRWINWRARCISQILCQIYLFSAAHPYQGRRGSSHRTGAGHTLARYGYAKFSASSCLGITFLVQKVLFNAFHTVSSLAFFINWAQEMGKKDVF